MVERLYVVTEYFYVATELAKEGRIYIVTELGTTENSAAHDRDGSVKAGAHIRSWVCTTKARTQ